ncbi:hypothetical protein [Arthrobacter sp. Soil736]|uniref:hypothetical protein n=1 Tax=Arthrobacter sp. Soil736 TaxID=1736395 RepID=UPI001F11D3A3|nr:hypothetical protein [Arthrobacter sp. Soil736]
MGSVLILFLAMFTVTSAAPGAAAPAPDEHCGAGSAINFDASDFQASPRIDNTWFPLKPGMQFTTTGTVTSTVTTTGTVTSTVTTKRTVIHTVTGLTKVIDGVKTLVMWDRDFSDGELVESELAFFAQTRNGTVWLFGEYPEEYENGSFVGAPSTFIHGLDKAQAGIAMQASPRTGTADYVQAYAPKVDFLDCGDVFRTHQRVCVPTGCYNDVLEIDEYNPLEPDAGHQRKYYSAGTGLVKVTAVDGTEQEAMDLVKIKRLSSPGLREVNERALELDRHAYEVSRNVYAETAPAEIAAPR